MHILETLITKIHLQNKNIAPTVIEQIFPSLLVSNNNEMMKSKELHVLDQNLLKSHLYSTFVLPQTTEQNDMIHAIEVEVFRKINITTTIIIHKTDIALHLEIDLVMTRVLLLHKTLDHDLTIIKEIRDPIALLTDLLTDPLMDMTLVTDIDHARVQEITTILQHTHIPLDNLHEQEILDLLDPVHIQIQGTNLIQYNHKPKLIPLTSNYTGITQLKWQTL